MIKAFIWMAAVLWCGLAPGETSVEETPTAEPAGNGDALRLTIRNVSPYEGQLLVGVCEEADFLREHCTYRAIVPVEANPQLIRVPHTALPPGRYAVQVVYDRNANGRLDKNLLGIPTEPVGFSRNARGRFGPPRFRQVAIDYHGVPLEVVIDVH